MKLFSIKSRQDFISIQNSCKEPVIGKTMLLLYKPTKKTCINKNTKINEFIRFGFSVSKKIHKSAVKRNRVKRIFREAIRKILKENDGILTNKVDYEIIARKYVLNLKMNDVYIDLLNNLKVLKGD